MLIMMENHVGVSSHSQKARSSSPVPWVASSDRLRASLGRLHTRNTSTVIRIGQSELHTEYCYKNWPERYANKPIKRVELRALHLGVEDRTK